MAAGCDIDIASVTVGAVYGHPVDAAPTESEPVISFSVDKRIVDNSGLN